MFALKLNKPKQSLGRVYLYSAVYDQSTVVFVNNLEILFQEYKKLQHGF